MKKIVLALSALGALAACEVQKTDEGHAPRVRVEDRGDLPNYDVKPADVDVEVRQRAAEVKVPDIDVKVDTKRMNLPDIDVKVGDEVDADAPTPK